MFEFKDLTSMDVRDIYRELIEYKEFKKPNKTKRNELVYKYCYNRGEDKGLPTFPPARTVIDKMLFSEGLWYLFDTLSTLRQEKDKFYFLCDYTGRQHTVDGTAGWLVGNYKEDLPSIIKSLVDYGDVIVGKKKVDLPYNNDTALEHIYQSFAMGTKARFNT